MQRNRILGTLLLLALLAVGGWLLLHPATLSGESVLARLANAARAGLTGAARDSYLAAAEEDEGNETEILLEMADYWAHRVTYPTGRFDFRWVQEAAAQDALVERGVPAGRVIYERGASPLGLDPSQFTFLGPEPLESDTCINCFRYGKVAGRTNDILIDPTNPAIVYIASDGGGVWKTTNCCDTATTVWTPMTDAPELLGIAIGTLAMDPNNPNVIYAGTGDLRFGSFSFGSAGLLKSTDGGVNWAIKGADIFGPAYPNAPNYPQYQSIGKVAVDPNNSNTVVVGTKTGYFVSNDAGETWSAACYTNPHTTQRHDVTGLILHDTGTTTEIYIAIGTRGTPTQVQQDLNLNGANGIYKATLPASGCAAVGDWTLLTRPDNGWPAGTGSGIPVDQPGGNILGRIDIAMAPSNPLVMYAEVQATGPYTPTGASAAHQLLGVWRTVNGGATWELRTTNFDLQSSQGCSTTSGNQNWYNQDIIVDPNNPDVVYVDMIDVWRSTNGADTLENLSCGYTTSVDKDLHVDQHALAFRPGSSNYLMLANDGGIYYSDNINAATAAAVTFNQLNNTYGSIEWYSGDITANFATDTQPGINAGAQDNGSAVYVWAAGDPGPAEWRVRKGGDGMFARIEPVLRQRWYQESQNGNVAVSQSGPDGPQITINGGWTADTRSFIFPYELYKYGDTAVPNSGCNAVEGCEHLIAGSTRVWETIQGGIPATTWYPNSPNLTKGTLADRSFINQLAYAFTTPTIAIVGTNDGNVQYGFGLGQGTADTASWVNVTGGNAVLPNRPILDVVTSVTPTIGYAAVGGFDQNTPTTPGHVFEVTCNADCSSFTWENKSGNLPNIPIDSIMINPRFPQQVFAGSDWGLYYTDDINAASPTWYRFQAGLPNVMIWDMAVDRGYTTLALFTRSRGAYAWPLPDGPIGAPTSIALASLDSTPTAPRVSPWLLAGLVTVLPLAALAWRRRRN